MLIGVISDTHGSLPSRAYRALEGCDAIIHAGDIEGSAILDKLESIAPVTAVLGNCDHDDYGPSVGPVAEPLIGGVRFRIVHRPKDTGVPAGDVAVVINGHTHRSLVEKRGAVWYVNPGSASRPRDDSASIALITVENGAVCDIEIIALSSLPFE